MKPYIDYTDQEFKDLVFAQVKRLGFDKSHYIYKLVDLSFKDNWIPRLAYDGCTLVQDWQHPDLACYIHDWLFICGKRSQYANYVYLQVMLDIGMPEGKAMRRYHAVSIGYEWYYQFKKQRETNIGMDQIEDIMADDLPLAKHNN